MKALFFTVGANTPAARFRVQQFFPHFRARGVECTLRYAYGPGYQKYATSRFGAFMKLGGRLRRSLLTLDVRGHDVVMLQRTAFNETALPERLASLRNPRIIYDVDDSVFARPSGARSRAREHAFAQAVALAAHVICGNRYLADEAGAPHKTTIIPTVVDTDVFSPGDPRRAADRPVVIGWMGTASNFESLSTIVEPLRATLDEHPHVVFRLVSNGAFTPLSGHPRVEQIKWSAEDEVRLLQTFDIGLMPLLDNRVTRGKCGFKMIQYMAVGCPAVVSNVGANGDILGDSGAGLLMNRPEEWAQALAALIRDADTRRAMGQAGRKHAVAHYSVASVIDRYLEIFARVGAH